MNRGSTYLIWLAAGAAVTLFLGANARLAYVAFASQPACVPHARTGAAPDAATYSAAKSSC